jgi:8-amino-7-oxononanoate synthase
MGGERVLNFCSNNYLGLAGVEALRQAAAAAMERHGVGAGASRLIAGTLVPHVALEQELARWKGSEAALLFGSGYLANVGVLSCVAGEGDLILSDALNHASIIDGCRLSRAEVQVYRHLDLDHLEALLGQRAGGRRRVLVVSETIFSMDGDCLPVAEWAALCARYGALTMVDEAHAVGVVGPRGAGLAHGVEAPLDLQIGTLGKAFGVSGAYVCSSRVLIDYLINRCRTFIYTTAPDVPGCAAALAALEIIKGDDGEARRLRRAPGVGRLGPGLWGGGFGGAGTHIIPLRVRGGDEHLAMELTGHLLQKGIYAQGIRFPTVPAGSARLRFTLTADHGEEEIDQAIEAIGQLEGWEVSAPTR